ncbi:MAG: response regulator receiver protein [Methylomonas sp.]|nr:MAG: response regulator receiver protein [Methylomonas sp.]
MILLLADDNAQQQELAQQLLGVGYYCYAVSSISEAAAFIVSKAEVELLILLTQARLSPELQTLRGLVDIYLPVIVVSERVDEALLDHYHDAGIDSYITLPVNIRLLDNTIRSALRMRQLYHDQVRQCQQLLSFSQNVELEQDLAAKVYNSVLQSNLLQTEAVKADMSPLALFNGDVLLVEKTPDNHLYLLLGDFTGHGLTASVGAIPVADIFYSMARKGFALSDIVQAINLKLHKILPVNMFLAATAVALYPDSKTLSLITCGLPEHFIVNDRDSSYQTVYAKNFPLGITECIDLDIQNFRVDKHHHLFLMTDGVFEAENSQGQVFGALPILDALRQNLNLSIDTLKASLAEHTQGSTQQDDISIVELVCDVENIPWQASHKVQTVQPIKALHWKAGMEFDIDALRQVNPVPVIVNALMEIQGLQHFRQAIFLIVSELFANALDHGVLKLDSNLKKNPDGFMRFYQLREDRLSNWGQGRIGFLFRHQPTEQGGRLTIKVRDSGDGFNWSKHINTLDDNESLSGRGVKLLETLCSSLTYQGKGNRVTAVFDWKK